MTVLVYALQPHMLQAIDESSAVGTLQELSIKQAKKKKQIKAPSFYEDKFISLSQQARR